MRIRDIVWHEHLEEAQQIARTRNLPMAIKALGQGTNDKDDW